jgi:hypothetical protein
VSTIENLRVAPPQFPADEALKSRIGLVNERSAASFAKLTSFIEIERMSVVEHVTLSVVRGRTAGLLIAELRAPLDGQRLSDDKSVTSCGRIVSQ